MAKPPTRLSFRSTILKDWHRFWARWSQKRQKMQFLGIHVVVQCLVMTSSFILMPALWAPHKQAWARTTLFQLPWKTGALSWRGLDGLSHLMRWSYFILTHPTKCKITRTEFYNWKRSDAFNISQASNQFFLGFSLFIFFFSFFFFFLIFYVFFFYRTELISGIRKCKVVKANLQRKAQHRSCIRKCKFVKRNLQRKAQRQSF